MPLNCPQDDKHLRLSQPGGKPPRAPKPCRGKAALVVFALLGVAILAAAVGYTLFYLTNQAGHEQPPTTEVAKQPATRANLPQHHATQSRATKPAPEPFCQRNFSATQARRRDMEELKAAGGLVHLLKRKQTEPPFKCAAYYLTLGLDVNAVGPNGLTPLHYAIKANRPKMVQFVIAHGANLHKKAGKKQLEPMSYAYYLAFNNPKIDRNRIIAILNQALISETGKQ